MTSPFRLQQFKSLFTQLRHSVFAVARALNVDTASSEWLVVASYINNTDKALSIDDVLVRDVTIQDDVRELFLAPAQAVDRSVAATRTRNALKWLLMDVARWCGKEETLQKLLLPAAEKYTDDHGSEYDQLWMDEFVTEAHKRCGSIGKLATSALRLAGFKPQYGDAVEDELTGVVDTAHVEREFMSRVMYQLLAGDAEERAHIRDALLALQPTSGNISHMIALSTNTVAADAECGALWAREIAFECSESGLNAMTPQLTSVILDAISRWCGDIHYNARSQPVVFGGNSVSLGEVAGYIGSLSTLRNLMWRNARLVADCDVSGDVSMPKHVHSYLVACMESFANLLACLKSYRDNTDALAITVTRLMRTKLADVCSVSVIGGRIGHLVAKLNELRSGWLMNSYDDTLTVPESSWLAQLLKTMEICWKGICQVISHVVSCVVC